MPEECEETKRLKLMLLEGVVNQAVLKERERCVAIAMESCICGGSAGCEGCWAAEKIREGPKE